MDVALLVDEAMIGVIAEDLRALPGRLEPGLELADRLRRAPVVAVGEMALQRHLDIARPGDRLRWQPVEANRGAELGHAGCAQDRHCPTQAEAGEANLDAGA